MYCGVFLSNRCTIGCTILQENTSVVDKHLKNSIARVVELADTQDLGSCAFGRGGSSPPSRTSLRNKDLRRKSRKSLLLFRAEFYKSSTWKRELVSADVMPIGRAYARRQALAHCVLQQPPAVRAWC